MPFLSKKIESQKLVAIIFVSQFIASVITLRNCSITAENLQSLFEWIHSLIEILLVNAEDKAALIRKHCLKGLGHVSVLLKYNFKGLIIGENSNENLAENTINFQIDAEKTQAILEALSCGMEDSSEICAREALFSLQRLIQLFEIQVVSPNLFSFLMRLPDNFERSDAITRMGAFNLLGKIANLLTLQQENSNKIVETLHFQVISLVLHINDENQAVKQASINSLNSLASLFNLNELKSLIESLSENNKFSNTLFDKNESFLLKTMEILCEAFPEKLMKYIASLYGFCSSPDDNIKGIAALLLCQCLVFEKEEINENIVYKLCGLLEEKSVSVQEKVIKGMSLLNSLVKS